MSRSPAASPSPEQPLPDAEAAGAPEGPAGEEHDGEQAAGPDGGRAADLPGDLPADLDAELDLSEAEAEFSECAQGPESDAGAPRVPPRWVRWTVVPLLVLVPMGYVVISAAQSRGAGESEQQAVAARQLEQVYPTLLQQRIYQVRVPVGSRYTRYLETNTWDTSVFYAEFLTTAGGLDTFLAQIGTSRAALIPDKVTMTAAQSKAAGWNFAIPRAWAGLTLHQFGDKPDHNVTVDLTYPDTPRVYVVSTVNFQHGFGGGS